MYYKQIARRIAIKIFKRTSVIGKIVPLKESEFAPKCFIASKHVHNKIKIKIASRIKIQPAIFSID